MTRFLPPVLVLMSLLSSACSDNFLQPKENEPTNIDNRLTLKGEVCTSPPNPAQFPVKVVLIIDQSGSMCVSDPPGSQGVMGFCEDALANITMNSGIAIPPEPARVRAVKRLLTSFRTQPNVKVTIVPFETNIKGAWPTNVPPNTSKFVPMADDSFYQDAIARVGSYQSELGKGTDYQGALAYAYGVIAADIALVERTNPEELPRTRYVTVFLTDGVPFPRCAANDSLPMPAYADYLHPELIWADAFGAQTFCNATDPMDPDTITGFVAGTDRNQNYQLYSYVDNMMELKSSHNVGDVRLHTILLFNEEAVRNCGPICQDLYGRYTTANGAFEAHEIARYILRKLAERGNGIYQEYNDWAGIGQISLGAIDYSSLVAKNVMKTLVVRSLTAAPGDEDRLLDADGDGLIDDMDNDFFAQTWKAQKFNADSDGDCFDDNFEVMHYDEGFRPDVKDGRGCDPSSPLTMGCNCRDNDGDGLSQYAEDYLGTRISVFDSDGDGIPDGLEARYGLDPLSAQVSGLDTDGDGNPDYAEYKADSNPIRRDNRFFDKNGYEYEITPLPQTDNTMCYRFAVSNLQLVTTDAQQNVDRLGFNLFKVYFAESPESGVATDYGVWRTACAWAQYAPPTIRVPAGPEIDFGPASAGAFHPPNDMATSADYLAQGRCAGIHP